MRRSLLIAVCFVFAAGAVAAQPPGSIGLFADPGGTVCDVYDQAPGLVTIYVVHVFSPGATAAQFMVDHWSWGAVLTFLGETVTPPYLGIGNSQTGIAIAYGNCIPSPNMILTIQFFGNGISAPCSYVQVVADPAAPTGQVEIVDCTMPVPIKQIGTGGDVVVNPDPSCYCNIPVEESTWGRVKSLYR